MALPPNLTLKDVARITGLPVNKVRRYQSRLGISVLCVRVNRCVLVFPRDATIAALLARGLSLDLT